MLTLKRGKLWVPFRAFTRHHGEFLRYGNSFPPNFPILRDVSFPLSGNRGYDSNRSVFRFKMGGLSNPRKQGKSSPFLKERYILRVSYHGNLLCEPNLIGTRGRIHKNLLKKSVKTFLKIDSTKFVRMLLSAIFEKFLRSQIYS